MRCVQEKVEVLFGKGEGKREGMNESAILDFEHPGIGPSLPAFP
jgi:hypothetical protein